MRVDRCGLFRGHSFTLILFYCFLERWKQFFSEPIYRRKVSQVLGLTDFAFSETFFDAAWIDIRFGVGNKTRIKQSRCLTGPFCRTEEKYFHEGQFE